MSGAILGVSAFYHDSAAVLLVDGDIVAAAHEERFTRQKHTREFPASVIKYCLSEGGIRISDLDSVAFYDKPWVERIRRVVVEGHYQRYSNQRQAVT